MKGKLITDYRFTHHVHIPTDVKRYLRMLSISKLFNKDTWFKNTK